MGDRVLLQVIKRNEVPGYSPVIYCHWLKARMEGRPGDIEDAAARLVQEVINGDGGNTGFGLMLADRPLTAEDSHGDAGVILVDANTFEMTFLGGYLPHGDGS